jgi:hypothetical protein
MIYSRSKFNYGHTVDLTNQNIPFDEGGSELNAVIEPGSYSLSEFLVAIKTALETEGALTYTVTVNRSTNVITVSASSNFSLLTGTGTTLSSSAFDLMGFSTGTDLTGASTYVGNFGSGSEYFPQFWLQRYIPKEHFEQLADATVNKAASGRVEVVTFGREKFIELEIKFVTNLPMDGRVIYNNPTGVEDALDFLRYGISKAPFEFVPDTANPSSFSKVLLESTPGFSNGTGFKLRELIDQNLTDIYDIGLITLRVLT